MASLRHQLLDGDKVLISIVGGQQQYRVPISEAKRFAWALLADLDPDEAADAGYVDCAPKHRSTPTRDHSQGTGPWQQRLILDMLARGPASAAEVAAEIATSVGQANVQLSRLTKRGVLTKVTEGRIGSPGIWRLA